MSPLPRNPAHLRLRAFAAFCEDLHDIAVGKARSCHRTRAIAEIIRQTKPMERTHDGDRSR